MEIKLKMYTKMYRFHNLNKNRDRLKEIGFDITIKVIIMSFFTSAQTDLLKITTNPNILKINSGLNAYLHNVKFIYNKN